MAEKKVRPMAQQLYEDLLANAPPTPGARVDFGIDSDDHYRALQIGVRDGDISAAQLDAALGSGVHLSRLARDVPDTPYTDIVFTTCWDDIYGRDPRAIIEAESQDRDRER